jgi:hypothetical protein
MLYSKTGVVYFDLEDAIILDELGFHWEEATNTVEIS